MNRLLGGNRTVEDVQELSKALNKVSNGKVDVVDVQPLQKGLKTHASEGELQKRVSSISVDNVQELSKALIKVSNGKVDVADVQPVWKSLKTHASEGEVQKRVSSISVDNVQELSKALNKVSNGKVDVADVQPVLKGLKIHPSEGELQEIVSSISVDNVQELSKVLNKVSNGKVDVADVQPELKGLKTHASEGELQKRVSSIPVDNVQELSKALNKVSNGKVDVADVQPVLKGLKTHASEGELQERVSSISVDNVQELSKALNKVSNGKVDVADVQPVLKGLKTHASEGEVQKRVSSISVDREKIDVNNVDTVLQNIGIPLIEGEPQNLQEHLSSTDEKVGFDDIGIILEKKGSHFSDKESERLSLHESEDTIAIRDLDSSLGYMDTELIKEELDELKRNLPDEAKAETDLKPLTDRREVTSGSQVDVHDVDSFLGNMTLKPTPSEPSDLSSDLLVDERGESDTSDMKKIPEIMEIEPENKDHWEMVNDQPMNVEEKTDLRKLTDAVKVESGEEVDVSNVESVLENISPELTARGSQVLMENELVDYKTYEMRLEDDVKSLQDSEKTYEMRLEEGIRSLQGKEADVDALENVENVLLEHTDQEGLKEMKNLLIDVHGKIEIENLLDGVKGFIEGTLDVTKLDTDVTKLETDVTKLDTVVQDMGMQFTEEERGDLVENIPFDDTEEAELKKLIDTMKTGRKVSANDIIKVLGNMGIEITEKEFTKLLQVLPMDDAGKVYENKLLDGVKSIKGGIVKSKNLDTALGSLEIILTKKEHADLMKILPFNSSGKVHLRNLLEAAKSITGEEIAVSDIRNVLENMGVTLTDQEHEELVESLPVNANGKLYQNRLMDSLKSLNGGLANVKKIDSVLENIGWKLTEEEIKDLRHNLPIDVQGSNNIPMKTLLDGLKPFTGEKMDVRNVPDMLRNMCLQLIDKEQMKLLSELPVDATGKIYKNRLLDGVKSFIGGKVEKDKMDTVLESLGIMLTENELGHLADSVPVIESGKVNFNELMDKVKIITGDEEKSSEIKNILENMGIELTEKEHAELMENLPMDADEKFYHNRLMEALKSLRGGKADINKLDTLLENMGMTVSEAEFKDMENNVPVNDDGKVEMTKLIDEMKVFSGEKIDINDLQNTVESMGIELTKEEFSKLQETLPVDDAEMVFQNRVLDGMKSLKGGKVSVSDIDSVLENIGIKLTESELEDLAEHVTVDDNEKVSFTELMDGVKALTGGEIDGNEVKDVLEHMGIYPTEKEMLKLLKNLPTNDNGKIYQNRLMDDVKSLKEGTMDVNKLDTFLGNMSMRLSETELTDLTQKLPVDVDRKADLKKVMDEINKTLGKKVYVSDLQSLLKTMGIELTDTECSELKEALPTDAAGQVFQNRMMDGVTSIPGVVVNVNDVDKVLGNMGIELTEKELERVMENLPANSDGMVGLNELIDEAKATIGDKIDIRDIKDVLENIGIELTDKECLDLLEKLPIDANKNVYQNRLLEGIKTFREGKIEASKLDPVLRIMGINLTEKELQDLEQNLPVNVDGKIDVKKVMDEVKDFTGERVDIQNLENVLRKMGIKLADKEYAKLIKTLPLSDDGKVHPVRALKEVTSFKGGKVEIIKLKPLLESMNINLTEKELEKLNENLPDDVNGQVDLTKVIDGVKAVTGGNVGIHDVKTVLEDMGLELKDKELLELVTSLLFDDDEKIFQNRLLEGVKSLKGGKVNVDSLKTLLENMGIKLMDVELKDLIQNLPIDVDRKISLPTLLNKSKDFTGEKVDSSHLKNILKNLELELTEKEQEKLLQTLPVDGAGKVYYNRLLSGLTALEGGIVHIDKLHNVLEKLGIKLLEGEYAKLLENLQVDDDGKVNMKEVMDEVRAITGGEVDARDVKSTLTNMKLELTDKELLNLIENLPFNDDNKIFENRLLEGVKSLKLGKVDVDNLYTCLENLGIKLKDKEFQDLLENIPVGVDGKIPLETLLEKVKDFIGMKIDSRNLQSVLESLGIELTEKEVEDLLSTLPVDDAGKIYYNKLLNYLKSLKGGKIKKNDLHNSLEKMGIKITVGEFDKLSENLQVDENGNVDLPDVMEGVKDTTVEKIDIKNLDTILDDMGIKLTNKELEDLIQSLPVSDDNKVALKTLENELKAFTGKKIDSSDIQHTLKNMGIELSDKECKQLLKTLPVDDDGKVFQNRVLKDLKNNRRGKVSVNNLDGILEMMNVKLTEYEHDQLKDLLRDGYEKVPLEKWMDKVEAITGKEIDVNDVKTVLGDMGIEVMEKEVSELVNNLPVNDGKVYQKRLLDSLNYLNVGKVDSSEVDAILKSMGINLSENELEDLKLNLPADVDGKIDLKILMSEVRAFIGRKIDINKIDGFLEDLGIDLKPNEYLDLLKTLPVSEDGKVSEQRLMKSIMSLQVGEVDIDKLDTLLENMGITFTEEEFMDLEEKLTKDGQKKIKLNDVMKELTSIWGEDINFSNLDNSLKDMKVELTNKEYFRLLKSLPRNAEEKVYKKRLMESVKALKGGKVDVNNLYTFLEYMGVELSAGEFEDFLQDLQIDDDGKIDLKNVVGKLKDFTGEKVNTRDVKNILEDMGIKVSTKECKKLLASLPVDGDKVFQNRLLKDLKSFNGGEVNVNNLNQTLGSMGIQLKNKELKKLIQMQSVDVTADENVPLKKVINDVNTITGKL
ncbi:fap1 adhesin-like [Dipodomys merriami]|uniref:fap1 adhesin-like n=1 Tax=Dipodomys merriami TaxID=94247 RepID=UPI003855B97B